MAFALCSLQPNDELKGKVAALEKRFDKQLKDNWGLETLVSVGESWMPAMQEQVRQAWESGTRHANYLCAVFLCRPAQVRVMQLLHNMCVSQSQSPSLDAPGTLASHVANKHTYV